MISVFLKVCNKPNDNQRCADRPHSNVALLLVTDKANLTFLCTSPLKENFVY